MTKEEITDFVEALQDHAGELAIKSVRRSKVVLKMLAKLDREGVALEMDVFVRVQWKLIAKTEDEQKFEGCSTRRIQ